MKKEPIFFVCIAFILGIVFQDSYPQDFWVLFSVLLFIFSVSIFIYFVKNRFVEYSLLILFFCFGMLLHQIQEPKSPKVEINSKDVVQFRLLKKLNSNASNRRYIVEVYSKSISFIAVASIPKEQNSLDFEHQYQSSGFIRLVEPPKNKYQFNYQKYLKRQGVFYQMYFPNEIQSTKVSLLSFSTKIKQWRLTILNSISDLPEVSTSNKEFLKGIILADRTEMDASVVSDFNKTGLVHILAISGSHMVVIFALIYFIFSKLRLPKKGVIVISLICIWLFSILIDYGNSVVRSSLMLTIYYVYVILERKPDLIHSLSLSAMLILLWDTNQIFDVGFQLSFVAVLGIFWLNKPISSLFPETKNVVLNYAKTVFSLTLSAQLATLPLLIYYFHQFPLISILANLVMVFVAQIFIVFSFCYVMLLGFGLQFSILNWFYDQFATIFLRLVHFFGSFDGQLVENISMNWVEVLLLFVLCYFLRIVLVRRSMKDVLRFSYLLLLFYSVRLFSDYIAFQKSESLVHSTFKTSLFSVKQGDHVDFYIPEGSKMIDVEKYSIQPYIVDRRVKTYSVTMFPSDASEVSFQGKDYNLKSK